MLLLLLNYLSGSNIEERSSSCVNPLYLSGEQVTYQESMTTCNKHAIFHDHMWLFFNISFDVNVGHCNFGDFYGWTSFKCIEEGKNYLFHA